MLINGDQARQKLAAIRLINGALALLAPRFLIRRLGTDPDVDASGRYTVPDVRDPHPDHRY